MFGKYAGILRENTHAEMQFQNCTSAWVFSCKCTAYFQSTFSKKTCGRLLLKDLERDIDYALGEFVIPLMEVGETAYCFY